VGLGAARPPAALPREQLVAQWAAQYPTPLARRDLAVSGIDEEARLEFAVFLHQELRIRFARRVRFLQELPFGLAGYPGIRGLIQRHTSYVADLEELKPPTAPCHDKDFTNHLRHIIAQQHYFEEDLFNSFREFAHSKGPSYAEVQPKIDELLQHIIAANIGTKVLMRHHVSSGTRREGTVGVVSLQSSPVQLAQAVAKDCKALCRREMGEAPEIDVQGTSDEAVALVPGYIHYMLAEVLKNACKATVEHHSGGALPSVIVKVVAGPNRVTFHIRDQGKGMSASALGKAWRFMHTTCRAADRGAGGGLSTGGSSLAGFGVGLPTARLYARHFGGDLQLSSEEGVGTEARVIVNTCGSCRLGPLAGFGLQVLMTTPSE